MRDTSEVNKDKMGEFNNQIVELVDKLELAPLETIYVLRMTADRIEKSFDASVRGNG